MTFGQLGRAGEGQFGLVGQFSPKTPRVIYEHEKQFGHTPSQIKFHATDPRSFQTRKFGVCQIHSAYNYAQRISSLHEI